MTLNLKMIFDQSAMTIHQGNDSNFNKSCWGKLDIHMRNNEAESLLYTVYKNLLKMDQSPKSTA